MKFTKHQINYLKGLQSDRRWVEIENALAEYVKESFTYASVKRNSEFETIWNCAYTEGGKYHLLNFFKILEDECLKSND